VRSVAPAGNLGHALEGGEQLDGEFDAIFDAVGVRIKTLPITPEKVLRALEKERTE
jgi:hypothetical protein